MFQPIVIDIFPEPSGGIRGVAMAFHKNSKGKERRIAHAYLLENKKLDISFDPPNRVTLDELATIASTLKEFGEKLREANAS